MLKKLFGMESLDYDALMDEGALIIDVRSPAEFSTGHASGSINIPLGDIEAKAVELKKKNKPIIACCRSGMRSGKAAGILKQAGVEAYNGGSWNSVQDALDRL